MSAYDPMFDREDLNNDRNYCQHGTFIGNAFGGDYMCGWCESGETPPTQRELDEYEVSRAEKAYDRMVECFATLPVELRCKMIRVLVEVTGTETSAERRAWDRLNR